MNVSFLLLLAALVGINLVRAAPGLPVGGIDDAESVLRAVTAASERDRDFMSDLAARLARVHVRTETPPPHRADFGLPPPRDGVTAPPSSPRRPAPDVLAERKRIREHTGAESSAPPPQRRP
ncbi:hypothetical protein PSEUBRA_006099 [Kalmanozyma brasiliensis GHG001]|uniref:uncharacterized protein n=1 Tax=Kalmanozyma brasiliensis (strain GHG001) TaxID=1365824 RepID=UPI001CEA0CEE|nr:uncharacterized protein PSEUBRA_006099 [Kalmanozyma brasiliensis GHG001]KAF6767615.1 hypothetical protein PSEUBRA_006099 [Kalmanozyma brasiliensis GHG001]